MNVTVVNCSNCGGPLALVTGQFICRCTYCGNPYYVDQDQPPAVVLARELDASQARDAVLAGLRDSRIEPGFRRRTFFERATLYYIPFAEVRGIKAGWAPSPEENGGTDTFACVSFEYLEPVNSLSAVSLDVLDRNLVETAMLQARQDPFRPVEMRRNGLVLPAALPRALAADTGGTDLRETVETHLRLVYFPVWEIAYSYRGMVFRSYCSAVDGTPIMISGLRSHRRKLGLALLGSFSLALLTARALRLSLFLLRIGGAHPLSLFLAGALTAGAGLAWAVLFPYLWRLFAFREEIRISGGFADTRAIAYREGALLRFSRRFIRRLTGEPLAEEGES